MRWPLDKYWISQGFTATHQGNDLATVGATYDDPVNAPEDGVVTAVNNNATGYFGGKYIKLRGDSGHEYYLGHNNRNYVSAGQRVSEGQHIADVGATGVADGPHIHYQIWNPQGVLVDPSEVMKSVKEEDMAEKVNLDTARILAHMSLARDGYDGRPSAHAGGADDDLKKHHVGKELTNKYIRDNFFSSAEASKAFSIKDAVYKERDRLRKLVKDAEAVVPAGTDAEKKLRALTNALKDALDLK